MLSSEVGLVFLMHLSPYCWLCGIGDYILSFRYYLVMFVLIDLIDLIDLSTIPVSFMSRTLGIIIRVQKII